MDAVALAATIGGSVVALAGVGATAWGIKQQRESAKELEESRQEHERQLASGARFYKKLHTFGSKDVADAYEEFVTSVVGFHLVASTLPASQEIPGADLIWKQLDNMRNALRDDRAAIELLVSDELASL